MSRCFFLWKRDVSETFQYQSLPGTVCEFLRKGSPWKKNVAVVCKNKYSLVSFDAVYFCPVNITCHSKHKQGMTNIPLFLITIEQSFLDFCGFRFVAKSTVGREQISTPLEGFFMLLACWWLPGMP